MQKVAVDAFNALRLRDYARVDLRMNAKEEIYVIEVNPNCYLERSAEFSTAAAKGGTGYEDLIGRIVALASARYSRCNQGRATKAGSRAGFLQSFQPLSWQTASGASGSFLAPSLRRPLCSFLAPFFAPPFFAALRPFFAAICLSVWS